MNWYKKAQADDYFGEDEDIIGGVIEDKFKDEAKKAAELRKKRLQKDKRNFAPMKKVKTTMGVRREGTIVDPFPWGDSNDGTFKEPGPDDLPIVWDDSTKGYHNKAFLEVIV